VELLAQEWGDPGCCALRGSLAPRKGFGLSAALICEPALTPAAVFLQEAQKSPGFEMSPEKVV